MPAEIVNLNKFRKARERVEKERQAEENRAKFGRTKEERGRDEDVQERRDRLLDGAKLPAAEPAGDARSGNATGEADGGDLDPGTVS